MKKVLIAALALSFMAVTSGLVLADGTAPTPSKKKTHVKHHKKSAAKPATSTAPAATPAK